MKKLIYLFIALFLIVFEMVPEGLRIQGHYGIAGMFEFVFLAVITLSTFAFFSGQNIFFPYRKYWRVIIGYLLLRFAISDLIFNLSAGQDIFYIGNTKFYDQFWQWFFHWSKIPVSFFTVIVKFMWCIPGAIILLWRKEERRDKLR